MDLIFLRQTEGKSNWKIDTISVVQELKLFGRPRKLIGGWIEETTQSNLRNMVPDNYTLINRLFWAIL